MKNTESVTGSPYSVPGMRYMGLFGCRLTEAAGGSQEGQRSETLATDEVRKADRSRVSGPPVPG
jgi:hypothetical protein